MSINGVFQSYIIRNVIFEFLTDKEKLRFTSCDRFVYSKRTSIVFIEKYFVTKNDISWKYYNQLTKVIVFDIFKFPINLKFLELRSVFEIKMEDDDLPQTLVYLKLDEGVYEDYKDKIPKNAIIEFNPNSSKEDQHRQTYRMAQEKLKNFSFS